MNKTFEHRGGQQFEKYLEFTTWIGEGNKKLILVKSVIKVGVDQVTLMDSLEPHYYSKGHWFVLDENKYDMGVVRLAYPIATRALTLDSALW